MRSDKKIRLKIVGNWQEDPCEFTLLSMSVLSHLFEIYVQRFGERFYDDACTNYGMTAAFLSCAAQAHNQGTCTEMCIFMYRSFCGHQHFYLPVS